jgi:hypothetical protein
VLADVLLGRMMYRGKDAAPGHLLAKMRVESGGAEL